MNKKTSLQKKAITLRKRGLSYGEIRKQIPVAKSSLSVWLKDIQLSDSHHARLYSKQIKILAQGAPSQHERRKREIETIITGAKKEISNPLSFETRRFLGAALYWAEGSKTKNLAITNSDPVLIAFMVQWFSKMFGVSPSLMTAHLNIYPQQSETDIKKFWSELTGIPIQNFGKSFIKPVSKGFKKNNLYYGTIKVRVPRGTDMRYRIFGWIQAALEDLSPQIESTQIRWSDLKTVERPANLD